MKKTLLKLGGVILAGFFTFAGIAQADPVAVRGNTIFWANEDLEVYEMTNTSPFAVWEDTITAVNATDVTLKGNKAIVSGGTELQVFDVSDYIGDNESSEDESSEDGSSGNATAPGQGTQGSMAQYDSRHGSLSIPEVNVDGEVYTVEMEQRGASNNWEVTFIETVESGDIEEDAASMPDNPTDE